MKDISFRDYVLDQLTNIVNIQAKSMFGGFGLYADNTFFGIISDGVLYLKTDTDTRKKYQERGMTPFSPNHKQTLKNYYEVPEEIIDDVDGLCALVKESIDIARI